MKSSLEFEIQLKSASLETLDEAKFFSGFLLDAHRPTAQSDLLIRTNQSTNWSAFSTSEVSIALDRRWLEHMYCAQLIIVGFNSTAGSIEDEKRQIEEYYYNLFAGFIMSVSCEVACGEPDSYVNYALQLARHFEEEISQYRSFQEIAINDQSMVKQSPWHSLTLPSIAYFHELGHSEHERVNAVRDEIAHFHEFAWETCSNELAERVYQIDGTRYNGTGASVAHIVAPGAPSYDELASSMFSVLVGLQDEVTAKEVLADNFMIKSCYDLFIGDIRSERGFVQRYGADVYIGGLFFSFVELNNNIATAIHRVRSFGMQSSQNYTDEMLRGLHEVTTRKNCAILFMQQLVLARHSYENTSRFVMLRHKEYPIDQFTGELNQIISTLNKTVLPFLKKLSSSTPKTLKPMHKNFCRQSALDEIFKVTGLKDVRLQ